MTRHLLTSVSLMVLTALMATDARAGGDRERVLQRGTDAATGAWIGLKHPTFAGAIADLADQARNGTPREAAHCHRVRLG